MNKKCTAAKKPKFKMGKMTEVEKKAAKKAAIANAPVPPNRDMSMKNGTSI